MYTLIGNLKLKNQRQHRVACNCHYPMSKSPYPRMATALLNSTKSQPRNHYLSTLNQLSPPNPNSTSFATNENASRTEVPQIYLQRLKQRLYTFDDILRLNGYPENSIEQTKRPQNPQRHPQPANTEWSYLKIPYISEGLNHRITNIFRKENIPVSIAHKSYTLKQAKPYPTPPRNANALETNASNTGLCLRKNAVYQLACNSCDQQYIGSTTCFIHDRALENISIMKTPLLKNVSIPARTKTIKVLTSRLLWAKTTPLIYASVKHFTLESASLHSFPEKNVLNSQTFYFSNLF